MGKLKISFESIIENYNRKNEFITKVWVWIGLFSLFGISLFAKDTELPPEITIPLIEFPVPAEYFTSIYLLIITGLILRWVEAYQRSILFRQNIIEKLIKNGITVNKLKTDHRGLIDGVVYSSSTSVWGILPKLSNNKRKGFRNFFISILYLILKIVAFTAHFILPLLAVVIPSFKLYYSDMNPIIKLIVYSFSLVAIFVLCRAAFSEWKYFKKVLVKRILN